MALVFFANAGLTSRIMPFDPHEQFDRTVLELIEHNSGGAVPHTPTYQDALGRLYASHQAYASADHKGGHVTARSLAKLPIFHAENLHALIAGTIDVAALEANANIFGRYVAALPAALRVRAEGYRLKVVGRPIHHRKHHGVLAPGIHDPAHSLFLVPGAGPHHGLPGNYLYGSMFEVMHPGAAVSWTVQLHDADDGAASFDASTLLEVLVKLQEVLAGAPFHLSELTALDFKAK
jgi:hypothetical protein